MSLLEDAIEAHGGHARWQEASELEVRLRCGGIAMPSKGQPDAIRSVHARVDLRRPHVELAGLGVFDAESPRPRGMARRVRWTQADVVYFTGYALWGYCTAPFIFSEPGFRVRELPRRRLRVEYPAAIPAHSREQTFHFDEQGLLVRLDYTAEPVFGPLARAKHVCAEHRAFGGLIFPTRRRVTPRGLPLPLLVSIDVDGITVH